jgi:hypothetical protein
VVSDTLTCCQSFQNTKAVQAKAIIPGGRDLDSEVLDAVKESIEARHAFLIN